MLSERIVPGAPRPDCEGIDLLGLSDSGRTPEQAWYTPCKGVLDRILSLILLVITGPLILLAAGLVKLTSRGPAFYSQTRLGKYGRPFKIYKIRTMVDNCEQLTGPRWAVPCDPYVTAIGRILRYTHLDELPQLWNVLWGEMSLVGPRPERPEFIPVLAESIPCYPDRLLIRPGMTGLAQVQLPGDTDLESVRRKLVYDLYYLQWLGPWLDLRILLCTACKVLGIPFAVSQKLFWVPSGAAVELAPEAPASAREREAVPHANGRPPRFLLVEEGEGRA